MTEKSTAGMRSKWAIERAIKAGREISPESMQKYQDLMEKEGIALDPEMQAQLQTLQLQRLNQVVEQSQYNLRGHNNPILEQVTPRGQASMTNENIPWHLNENEQVLKEGGSENKYADRAPKGKKEKDWYDYFSNRFGPLVLFILWFCLADLEKATFYAPTPSELQPVALPLAKLATKVENWFHVPTWAHDMATSSDDLVSVGMAVTGYLDRIGVLERLFPYYMSLASRMSVKQHDRNQKETYHTGSNGAVPQATFAGIGSQHFTDV